MGHRTRAAVKVFQKDYGLTITGYVDKKTWEELNRVYEKKFSLKNADTTLIQTALKKAGFNPGPIDGKLGLKTKAAIKAFQKSNGLIADGKIGPKAWKELRKNL